VASEADHIAVANRNHETLAYLLRAGTAHPEWLAVVACYKAVHVVEAVFCTQLRRHSFSHDSRLATLKQKMFADLFGAYRPLYAASLIARYLEDRDAGQSGTRRFRTFTDYMPADAVAPRLVFKRLNAVEQHSVQFLTPIGRRTLSRVPTLLANGSSSPNNEIRTGDEASLDT
jgi:hypothetical protein